MHKRRLVIALTGCLLVGTAVALALFDGGPAYKGRSVRQWYAQIGSTNEPAARDAFEAMGSNSAPFLISIVERKETAFVRWYEKFHRSSSINLIRRLPEPRSSINNKYRALSALRWAGTNAAIAVPQLVRLYDNQPKLRINLVNVLADIAPGSPFEKEAVEILIRASADSDADTRQNALYNLGLFPNQRERTVPVLIETLNSPDNDLFAKAALGLEKLGLAAEKAVPELLRHARGLDSERSKRALYALEKVAPNEAAKVEPEQ